MAARISRAKSTSTVLSLVPALWVATMISFSLRPSLQAWQSANAADAVSKATQLRTAILSYWMLSINSAFFPPGKGLCVAWRSFGQSRLSQGNVLLTWAFEKRPKRTADAHALLPAWHMSLTFSPPIFAAACTAGVRNGAETGQTRSRRAGRSRMSGQ
jgi:hypothetical protein